MRIVALPHHIIGQTSIKLYSIFSVEVVIVDRENQLMLYDQMVATHVRSFFRDYGGGRGVMLLMVLILEIP